MPTTYMPTLGLHVGDLGIGDARLTMLVRAEVSVLMGSYPSLDGVLSRSAWLG
jgi:hypothetical protein